MDNGFVLFCIAFFLLTILSGKIIENIEYYFWKRKIRVTHDYDDSKIHQRLKQISQDSFTLSGSELPYGRSRWFVGGNEEFNKCEIDHLEFYGFSPVRSQEELDFHEYGILLTQNGIYGSWQEIDTDTKQKREIKVVSKFCPYAGLWKVAYNKEQHQIRFQYKPGKIEIIKTNSSETQIASLVQSLNALISTGYTNDLDTGYIEEKIKATLVKDPQLFGNDEMLGAKVGALGAIYANVPMHFQAELLNSIVSNPQGHGLAAEYANNLVDRVRNPFVEVKRVGQNNAKNGVDRIVGNTKIQTKYLSSARNSVNNAFDSKQEGGMYRYEGMQLEVPKDQYLESIDLMKQKIIEGKVPKVTNPDDAKQIIRKGSVTWKESKLIAKGGNIVSLKYDVLDGVFCTIPTASVSFAIVFAKAKWAGLSTKEAAIVSAKAGVKTLCMGTIVYAGSQQFAKLYTLKIANSTGRKIMAQNLAKNAGLVISFGIVITPDIFNTLAGRISRQQLLKNSVVAGGGFAAGVASYTAAGIALGSVVPGAGNVVGGIVGATAGVIGGIVGTTITKKVMDMFIEDDRNEMFAQLKEEFIDVVWSISLSEEELTIVQEYIFDKSLENKLKNMYHASKQGESRIYARERIVESAIETVFKKREQVREIELKEGIDYLVTAV